MLVIYLYSARVTDTRFLVTVNNFVTNNFPTLVSSAVQIQMCHPPQLSVRRDSCPVASPDTWKINSLKNFSVFVLHFLLRLPSPSVKIDKNNSIFTTNFLKKVLRIAKCVIVCSQVPAVIQFILSNISRTLGLPTLVLEDWRFFWQ